ncbi:UNVERIFIED_CONTAM: hypothetical protein NCL1_09022 [Trichonephila clavipes]
MWPRIFQLILLFPLLFGASSYVPSQKPFHRSMREATASVVFDTFPFFSETSMSGSSTVVKVSDHGRHVMSSSPVPLKTRRVGKRCTLNLSRAQTSSRWCGVVVSRGGYQLRSHPRHLTMVQNYVVCHQKL